MKEETDFLTEESRASEDDDPLSYAVICGSALLQSMSAAELPHLLKSLKIPYWSLSQVIKSLGRCHQRVEVCPISLLWIQTTTS